MKKYAFITKKYLIQEYSRNEKSAQQIANQIGCSKSCIRRRLKKYGIQMRSKSERQQTKYSFLTKEFIEKEYIAKSQHQIAKEIGCSQSLIHIKMEKFGIARKIGKGNYIGERASRYVDGRCSKKYYCKEPSCSNKISYTNWKRGSGRCRSCATKNIWKNKKFREKIVKAILKGLNLKPNKPEKQLYKLLQWLFPNEYKYVGDGKFFIGGFVPDFINVNSQKKIIELYGDYWHNKSEIKKRDKGRLRTYKRYGYKTLIIWEHELKNLDKVKEKILIFNNNKIRRVKNAKV